MVIRSKTGIIQKTLRMMKANIRLSRIEVRKPEIGRLPADPGNMLTQDVILWSNAKRL
jgi:hypothetical protein